MVLDVSEGVLPSSKTTSVFIMLIFGLIPLGKVWTPLPNSS